MEARRLEAMESGYGYSGLEEGTYLLFEKGGYDPAADIRRGFIRKVYGILTAQLLITACVCTAFMKIEGVRDFVLRTPALVYVGFALSLVCLFPLLYYRKHHPLNLVLLTGWTLIESYTVGVVCAAYATEGKYMVVLEALLVTFVIFLGLTVFTFQSKINFSFLGAGLFLGLWILVIWSVISWILGWQTGFVYCLFGAILFSAYIVYDTQRLSEEYSVDEYVSASIELYLDIVNLFLFILRLLDTKR